MVDTAPENVTVTPSPQQPPPPILGEISAAGDDGFASAYAGELASPRDEVLRVHGRGDFRLYERLMSDDQVEPTFRQRRSAVIARELKVEPGGPSELDKLAADDLRAQLKALPFDRITNRMLVGLMFGYRAGECMFSTEPRATGGLRVVLEGVKVRRTPRFGFNRQKQLVLIKGGQQEVMPDRKFWVLTCGAEDDDDLYGRGLGHFLYWPVWLKRNGIKFWALFLEQLAQGTPVATVPNGTNQADMDKVGASLDAIRVGGRLVIPKGVSVAMLEAARDAAGDYSAFVDRLDKVIANIVLLQSMTTVAADTGLGSNQGEVQERVGMMGEKADSDLVTESFQRGPATWLTEWNYPGAKTPLVYRDFSVQADQAAAAERDSKLFAIGYQPTPDRVRETYGEGYVPVTPAAAAPDPSAVQAAFAEQVVRDANDAVEDLVGGDRWRLLMDQPVGDIERMLDDSASLEEVRDRLGDLFAADPNKLVDGLARVMFAAKVQGNVGADQEKPK